VRSAGVYRSGIDQAGCFGCRRPPLQLAPFWNSGEKHAAKARTWVTFDLTVVIIVVKLY
jgi:hypothetical protein